MDFSPQTKAKIAYRKTLRRKQARQGILEQNAFSKRMAEIKKNQELDKNCPFELNLYYQIFDNDKFIGKYKFIGIDYRSEKYMWSTTDHVSHNIKFSPTTVKGKKIKFQEFIDYWYPLDNETSLSEA